MKYDHIVSISKIAAEKFDKAFDLGGKVRVIYNLMDIERIRKCAALPIPTQKRIFTVVSVCRIAPEKGIMIFLEACLLLKKRGVFFDYWLIGDGPDMQKAQNYARKENMDFVTFLGYQENPYSYIATADLYVSSTQKAEAYGNSVADSVFLGTPVMSTPDAGPMDILDGGNYGCITGYTASEMADSLEKIINSPELYAHYKEMTGKRAVFFDQDVRIRQIMELIE